MFIAIDRMSSDMPKDVRDLGTALSARVRKGKDLGELTAGAMLETAQTQIAAMNAAALDRWDVQSHQYTTKVAVETSILGRLFSGNADVSHYGVVQEAKRFCIRTTNEGRSVEYGTAVRLSVAVLATSFEGSLTLPNIAAKAQLSDLRARIALSVDGYAGTLGELLPAPDNLNVENLAVYTTAFKAIQALVFGTEGLAYITPTLLGYEGRSTEFEVAEAETAQKKK